MRGTGQVVTLHDVAIWSENAWVTIGLRRPSAAHTECCVGTTHGRGGPAAANGRGRPSSSSRLRRHPQLAPEALEMPFPLLPAWLAHAERLRPLAGGGRGVRRRRAPRYQIVARAQRTLLRRWCRTGSVSGRGETGHGTCHPAHEPAGGRSSPHEEEEASSACAREALETLPPPNRCVAGPRRMSMRRWPEGASACTRSDGKGVPRGTVVSRASTPGEAGLTKAFATRPMSRPGVSHPTSAGGGDILSLRPGVRDANPPQSRRGLPALHAAQSVAGCRRSGKAERSFSLQPEAKRDANPPRLALACPRRPVEVRPWT